MSSATIAASSGLRIVPAAVFEIRRPQPCEFVEEVGDRLTLALMKLCETVEGREQAL